MNPLFEDIRPQDDVRRQLSEIKKNDPSFDPLRYKRMDEMQNKIYTYQDALPDRGFIKQYCDLFIPTTCSPEEFHLIGALLTLATIVGNRVCIELGGRKIFPNLWVIILAPSTMYRKSTAIACSEKIIRLVDPELIHPDEFTREMMIQILSKKPYGLFSWKEFTNILQYFLLSYMLGTKEMLMEMFDSPSVYRRNIKSESFAIEYPAFSIFAASPISLLEKLMKESDLRGGFYSRFIYVPVIVRTRQTIPIPPAPDRILLGQIQYFLDNCIKPLCEASKVGRSGEFKPIIFKTDLIKKEYSNWMLAHENLIDGHPKEEILASFYVRLSTYCLKFAMLYQLSFLRETDAVREEQQIQPESLQFAINLTNFLRQRLTTLFMEELNVDEGWYPKQKQKMIKILKANGGKMNRRKLQSRSNLESNEFNRVLKSMHDDSTVKTIQEGKNVIIELSKIDTLEEF